MVLPLAIPTLPGQLATARGEQTKLRQGRIVALQGGQVTVAIGETVITTDAMHLAPYVPVLGDYVQIVWQGPTPLILGALTGQPPDNEARNWSFEDSAAGVGNPLHWGTWTVSGAATTEVVVVPDGMESHGRQAAKLTVTSAGGEVRLYSFPVQVMESQVWSAAAQVAIAGAGADEVTVSLHIAWQVNAGDFPPTVLQLDTVCEHTFIGRSPVWYQLRGGGGSAGRTAPAGANVARIILGVATAAANSAAFFDQVTFRLID